MENYLNILFIRLRPSGRYIFRRGRQVFEVVGLVKAGKRRENERETMKENGRKRMETMGERESTRKRLRVG